MKIGIVGFQGDVEEHAEMIEKISKKTGQKIELIRIKKKEDLKGIDGIIIPGGESTTIFKLIQEYNIYEEIKRMVIEEKVPFMGTCAGLIIASKNTNDPRVTGMGLLDVEIERNGYGRQSDSFIKEIDVKGIGLFNAVFIRAPIIRSYGDVEVLGYVNEKAVIIRKDNVLGLTFHPELTDDTRIHEFFINMIGRGRYISSGAYGMGVTV
ncbi:pyridoxal 5'-phosphate synthase glutaminase subunit PdxT [Cuniculiplasma sp. SKW4]|uniref:pyridoxal 5'-phosphate synthase glutaminase subunit PdxT n=1 Tax=Cuniculiplasma sp. SKW4 TaxID=3400171 RepID=UPI003FCFD16A